MKTAMSQLVLDINQERQDLKEGTLDPKKANALAQHSNTLINALRTQILFAHVSKITPIVPFISDEIK